ncbi:hypothetical protein LINPERPRIM_LOCUS10900, partial [Linum perenne]
MNRFIPKSAERQAPFFAILKAAAKFSWTEECSKAFEELKAFLTTPLTLAAPIPGDELYLEVFGIHNHQKGNRGEPQKDRSYRTDTAPQDGQRCQNIDRAVSGNEQIHPEVRREAGAILCHLKAAAKFSWTEECSKAFEELKAFLTTPPTLAAPIPGDELY